jgi:hypothetical protein
MHRRPALWRAPRFGIFTAALLALASGAAVGADTGQSAKAVPATNGAAGPDYADRLIDGGALELDSWSGDIPTRDSSGWPRGLRMDGIYSYVSGAGRSSSNAGFGFSAMLATPLYGTWSIDGVLNQQANQSNGVWVGPAGQTLDSNETTSLLTVWQRDVPFDDGWRASNGLGMLNTTAMDLARIQPRWVLAASPMVGVSTEWRSPFGGQLNASIGEPGTFTGTYVPGFRRLGGQVATLGGQWVIDRNWVAGAQYVGAKDVTSAWQPPGLDATFSTRSGLAAAGYSDGPHRFQVNLLESGNNVSGRHLGAWADALVIDGRYAHSFGAFHMGEDLAWANQPVGINARGAYYRINYASRQWLWDAYVDYSAPLSNDAIATTTFTSGSVRRQWSRDLGFGGGGSARFSQTNAWSGFVYMENQHPLVINRTQLSTGRNSDRSEAVLSASQTWSMPAGSRFSTTVAGGRYENGLASSNQFALAASGGGDLAPNVGLDLNLQWISATGEAQPTTLSGNLSLTWRFLPQLALIVNGYRSQSRSRTEFSPLTSPSVQSPLDSVPNLVQANERGAYVILRYETRAGSMVAPLGGVTGGGAGTISGVVYLDGNEDNRFTALEQGVPNVTVILDGRFSIRTDANGRFEFPMVAAGRHVLTVMPDNVPLAWHLPNDGRSEVEVPVRGSVNVDIGAQRLR